MPTPASETRLRRALFLRSTELVRRIILSSPNPHQLMRSPDPNDDGNTSLHIAAKLGLVDIANFFLEQGHEASGNISRNQLSITPLMLAAQAGDGDDEITKGRIQVGKLLIQRFPDSVGIRDKAGLDAFSHAALHDTVQILTYLLYPPSHLITHLNPYPYPNSAPPIPYIASSASSNEESTPPDPSPFSKTPYPTATALNPYSTTPPAASTNTLPQAHPASITTSMNPNSNTSTNPAATLPPILYLRDSAGNTPLHHACAKGNLKTLRLLVQAGADAGALNAAGWSPLEYSASVSAEVYLRGLVREREREMAEAVGREAERERAGRAEIRVVEE